jgi:hypothetical protein
MVCSTGFSQISSVSGQLQYQYRSEDFRSGDLSTTSTNQSPMINLGTKGFVVSPYILTFDLQTNIFGNYSSAGDGVNKVSGKQYTWNYYDLNLGLLQNLPIATSFNARDAVSESSSDLNRDATGVTKFRYQQQGMNVVANRISFLPAIQFSYLRSHEWSLTSANPVDQLRNGYSMNLSSMGKNGSVTVSGAINDNLERYTNTHLRYYTLHIQGNQFNENNDNLDVSLDYDKFDNLVNISGDVSYRTTLDKKFASFSSLHGRNNSGPAFQSSATGVSQSFGYVQNEHYRYNVGFGGQYGTDVYTIADAPAPINNYVISTSAAMAHTRALGRFSITNDLTGGMSLQNYQYAKTMVSVGFSNGVQTSLGNYRIALNEGSAYSHLKDGIDRTTIDHSASLSVTGDLFRGIQGQVTTNYHNSHLIDTSIGSPSRQDANLYWRLNGMFYTFIPLTVSLGGTTNWYFSEFSGKTYGWTLTVGSPRFFMQNLIMNYSLTRTYDHYYGREAMTNNLGFGYRWRSVTMDLRINDYRLVNQRRELWFSISRPF